ncbi:MAG: sigma-54 dependent transcriptional regulator, partial [Bacteroidota bacterium]
KDNSQTQGIPIIFMTSLHDTADKVKGFQLGAVDFITKPIHTEEVISRVKTHLRLKQLQEHLEEEVKARTHDLAQALEEVKALKNRLEAENSYLKEEIQSQHNFKEIISQSDHYTEILKKVTQVGPTQATVLLLGESGTGKELLARAIHHCSLRASEPLVKVNCATLSANLIESELFGHEKGAFTGALQKRIGRFELAHQGTLFLDEIGELPLELQAKLLRALQEGEFERLGSSRTLKVDVRFIVATNRDLEAEVYQGNFREDLYYRLNVFPIYNPPLRDRKEDIPLLVQHFIEKHGARLGRHIEKIPQRVIQELQAYDWPGNVRELENIIERSLILSPGKRLEVESLPIRRSAKAKNFPSLEEVEKKHILEALKKTHWKISGPGGAAELLHINAKTLASRIKKLNIQRPD